MPLRRRFYDPFIQEAEAAVAEETVEPTVAVFVPEAGLYFHVTQVALRLRALAGLYPAHAEALEAAAVSFEQAEVLEP